MPMTVNTLAKRMAELVAQGHGRKPVCINKRTFKHPLEDDGVTIMPIEAVQGPTWIPQGDDDGGTKINTDGTEAGHLTVVLEGGRQC